MGHITTVFKTVSIILDSINSSLAKGVVAVHLLIVDSCERLQYRTHCVSVSLKLIEKCAINAVFWIYQQAVTPAASVINDESENATVQLAWKMCEKSKNTVTISLKNAWKSPRWIWNERKITI